MAIVTNTYLTYATKGQREDLTDAIYNIDPTETPYMSNIGTGTAKFTFHEWQTDALDTAVTTNQVLEGDDVTTFPAVTASVRIGCHLNISRKLLILSDTDEVTDKAGRNSELAYQLAKRSKELKRDMESACLDNIADVAGGTTTIRVTPGLPAYLATNTDFGAGGADPTYTTVPNAARTDGTQRTFTEAIHKAVLQAMWTAGANVDRSFLMVGAFNKTEVSGFAGIADRVYNIDTPKTAAIIGAADVYVSDWGTIRVVANRFQRARDAWYIDPEYASLVYLRRFRTVPLAKTGDAEKRMLLVEWGHKVHNEKAHGAAFDLNTS